MIQQLTPSLILASDDKESPAIPGSHLHLISAAEIGPELTTAWRSLRSGQERYQSPYYDIEFTRAIARTRDDVRVAYVTQGDSVVAIFPFQTPGKNRMEPVGGRLNDVQGVISRSGKIYPLIKRLMTEHGYHSFGFHAARTVASDAEIKEFEFSRIASYHIDLSAGWEAYYRWAQKHSSTIARHGQKKRRLEREVGPIRFEFDVVDSSILEKLIDLKRAKYQRSKTFDILSVGWAANSLREIFSVREPGFRGLLSALWAGDQLVALHFGMLTDHLLHYWFPVYDPVFSRYSPGTELMLGVAQAASERGITKVDLGYGDDPYKLKFCNGTESLSCGRITSGRLAFQIARKRYHWRNRLKGLPMKPLVKTALRAVCPGFGSWNFR